MKLHRRNYVRRPRQDMPKSCDNVVQSF